MPPPLFFDPASVDCNQIIADKADIERRNPQRFEFSLLDRVVLFDKSAPDPRFCGRFAGYFDLQPGAWWGRGHIPGRPLFPGVLMIESAAQLCSFAWSAFIGPASERFLGFAAVDEVKFRGVIEPPARFLMLGLAEKMTERRCVANIQGFVSNKLVFEARITGMPV